jgi:hypothetical protein
MKKGGRGREGGNFVGIKKDLVISPRLERRFSEEYVFSIMGSLVVACGTVYCYPVLNPGKDQRIRGISDEPRPKSRNAE